VYYVAISLDGYISGVDGNIEGFVPEGDGVDRYLHDLKEYDTVIMGRNTYEFGYRYGLKPGQAPYPHMQHYIFSKDLKFDDKMDNVHIKKVDINEIQKLRKEEGTDIYLCGGGQFAGWLLEYEQIQYLKVKLNPIILGQGISLFGDSTKCVRTELLETTEYENGLQIINYKMLY
jgi:dihydrofolate reductase